jgi:hypothetical protein
MKYSDIATRRASINGKMALLQEELQKLEAIEKQLKLPAKLEITGNLYMEGDPTSPTISFTNEKGTYNLGELLLEDFFKIPYNRGYVEKMLYDGIELGQVKLTIERVDHE